MSQTLPFFTSCVEFLGKGLATLPSPPSDEECPICAEPYDGVDALTNEPAHELPVCLPCGHVFGLNCITTWTISEEKRTCPMCRAQLWADSSSLTELFDAIDVTPEFEESTELPQDFLFEARDLHAWASWIMNVGVAQGRYTSPLAAIPSASSPHDTLSVSAYFVYHGVSDSAEDFTVEFEGTRIDVRDVEVVMYAASVGREEAVLVLEGSEDIFDAIIMAGMGNEDL